MLTVRVMVGNVSLLRGCWCRARTDDNDADGGAGLRRSLWPQEPVAKEPELVAKEPEHVAKEPEHVDPAAYSIEICQQVHNMFLMVVGVGAT